MIKNNEWDKVFKEKWYARLAHPEVDSDKLSSDITAIVRQAIKEKLNKILGQGHGGGNWRRLIIQGIDEECKLCKEAPRFCSAHKPKQKND